MLKTGLVSVTFRKLTPQQIAELVARAGMDGIEWGGDVHVPHGDCACAREVRKLTLDAGLAVASYGSYYRVGEAQDFSFSQALDTAVELGAPLIRVWAGGRGSDDADAAYRAAVAEESREVAAQAAEAGLAVAYEFHGHTLTDTAESALDLLRAADHPNLFTYWQRPRGLSAAQSDASLAAVLPQLANVHVQWSRGLEVFAPTSASEEWRRLLGLAATGPARERFAMIEFVEGDVPEQLLEDAAGLREVVDDICETNPEA